MKTEDPRKPDAMIVAYYGTYSVDEASKKINAKIEAATYSPRANTDTSWTVEGTGEGLTLIGSARQGSARDVHSEAASEAPLSSFPAQ
jgi:hypothetical protein